MASTKISYTQTTPTNNLKYTISFWFKKAQPKISGTQYYMSAVVSGYANYWFIRSHNTDDNLDINNIASSGTGGRLITNRKFRDPSAWYHVVYVYDSANVTAGDRMKLYVNGVEETSFATDTNPTLNQASVPNSNSQVLDIGREDVAYFDGCMSHVQFVDGLALAPTEFGEFDSTSGIWKIKTGSYATPGNNGFHLKMEDASNLDLDSSSNAHTFTTTGTLTATKDNPSNNFATMNPLQNYIPAHTFSNGNNTITTTNSSETYSMSTMGLSAGKWYFEALLDASTYSIYSQIGIAVAPGRHAGDYIGQETWAYGTGFDNTGKYRQDGLATAYGNTWTGGDYLGCYMDLDNNKVYFAINGVIQNSGTGISITAAANTTGYGNYFFCVGDRHGDDSIWYCNFGNGYFGTTALTGTTYSDNDSIGTFKYSPNDGGASSFDSSAKNFMALCTKNIKAYGG